MEISRPLIMITNDDSVEAPGIHHLVECVREFGDVYVVAPAHPHSGQSSALTGWRPAPYPRVAVKGRRRALFYSQRNTRRLC